MKNTRGFVQLALIVPYVVGILIVAAGYEAYKVFEPGRNKKQADQVAAAAQQTQTQANAVDAQAVAVKTAVSEVEKAHAQKDALNEQIKSNAAGDVYGTGVALATEKNPSPNVQLAQAMNDAAFQALGVSLTAQQKAVYDQLLKAYGDTKISLEQAKAQINTMAVAQAATQASLTAVSAHAQASDAQATQLTQQLTTQTKQLTVTAAVGTKLAVENKDWADNAQTLWGRIKALGALAVILAAIAIIILIRLVGVKNALADMVALGEHLKAGLVAAGKDAIDIEKDVSAWWEGSKNQQVVNNIKTNVLRQ